MTSASLLTAVATSALTRPMAGHQEVDLWSGRKATIPDGENVFLGERLEPSQWVGVAMVLAAIGVILRRGGTEAANPIPAHSRA